jgi:hypothetical protein
MGAMRTTREVSGDATPDARPARAGTHLPLRINIGNDCHVIGIQIQVKTASISASRAARHSNLQKCPFVSFFEKKCPFVSGTHRMRYIGSTEIGFRKPHFRIRSPQTHRN